MRFYSLRNKSHRSWNNDFLCSQTFGKIFYHSTRTQTSRGRLSSFASELFGIYINQTRLRQQRKREAGINDKTDKIRGTIVNFKACLRMHSCKLAFCFLHKKLPEQKMCFLFLVCSFISLQWPAAKHQKTQAFIFVRTCLNLCEPFWNVATAQQVLTCMQVC